MAAFHCNAIKLFCLELIDSVRKCLAELQNKIIKAAIKQRPNHICHYNYYATLKYYI